MVAALNGLLVVALGAFGAHGLEGNVSASAMDRWEKAVQYQMFHTVALLGIGLLLSKVKEIPFIWAGWTFFIGIVLFSGSLYLYVLIDLRWLAMITPFGGFTFIIGWLLLGYGVIKFL